MSRNEVEMDLSKFMEILQSNSELKDKIRELEDASMTNPWQRWVHFAHTLDAYRIFPRIFFGLYCSLFAYSSLWFMGLEEASVQQMGFISTIVAVGAAWFGLYVSTGFGEKRGKK